MIRSWIYRRIRKWLSPFVLDILNNEPRIIGPVNRLQVSDKAVSNNFLANTNSGNIVIRDHVFFGKDAALITGSHDYSQFGEKRGREFPTSGRDIVIENGVWIGSRAIVLGPCVVGEDSVIAAGSVVTKDVPRRTIVAGIPARKIRSID
ncbi:acyltransferase [Rosistilla carotiformis]|uniref:acyltransferase n=1 Tax=Rosistilla carotiformis TaxID=2528017 RepID=UPI0011A04713|nr:acyltransferase [Rosistilla carotiformis]